MRGTLFRWTSVLLGAVVGMSCAADPPQGTRLRIFVSSDEVLVGDAFVAVVERQRPTAAGSCLRLRVSGPAVFAEDITASSQIADLRAESRSWTLRAQALGEVVLSVDLLERGDAGCEPARLVVGSVVPPRVVRVVTERTTRPTVIDAGPGDVPDAPASDVSAVNESDIHDASTVPEDRSAADAPTDVPDATEDAQ